MWLPLQQQLKDIGFRWDKFLAEQPAVVGPDGELARIRIAVTDALLPILNSRFKKLKLLQLEGEFRDLKSRLKLAARVAKASKVTGQLLAAVTDENCNRYRESARASAGTKEQASGPRPAPYLAYKAGDRRSRLVGRDSQSHRRAWPERAAARRRFGLDVAPAKR